ncbi:MAG: hypothetical protein AB8G15_18195 [Saprospiraceae bacterium]
MRSCKYLSLLRVICKKERKHFEQFLKRLYFNQKEVIRLFEYLKKFAPNFDSHDLTTQKIIRNFCKKKSFTKQEQKKVLNLLSDLHLHLKAFLVWKTIRTKPEEQNRLLSDFYKNNNFQKKYVAGLQQRKRKIEEKKLMTLNDLYQCMLLNDTIYYNLTPHNEFQTEETSYLQNVIRSLNQLYTIAQLKYACEILSKSPNSKVQYLEKEILKIERRRQGDSFEETALYFMYYKLFLLLRDKKFDTFIELKDFLFHINPKSAQLEQTFLIDKLLRFAQKAIQQRSLKFNQEYFEICQWALANGLLLQKQLFTSDRFANLIDVALALNQTDWAENFIVTYASQLSEEGRREIIQSAYAQILFKRGAYQKSIPILLQVRIINDYHSMRVRALLLKNYYEIVADVETILKEINNFNRFLNRKADLNPQRLKAYQNFLRIFKKLTLQKSKKENLLKDFWTASSLIAIPWLQQKTKSYTRFE